MRAKNNNNIIYKNNFKINGWIPITKNKVNAVEIKPKRKIVTFYDSLRLTLLVGQVFALLPVFGVFGKNASNIRFCWSSWKCLYFMLSLSGQAFMAAMCIHKLLNWDTSLKATTSVIFYMMTVITMLIFFQIARRWPTLVQHIARTEEMDPNFDTNLLYKCNFTCVVVLTLALFEHILSLLSALAGASSCYPNTGVYEGFAKYFYPWVFHFLPYSAPLAFLTQFLHFQSTFIWNFSDLFVICMSYYLTSRLVQVNERLMAAQGKYLPESFWRTTREDYSRATQLVRRVDEVISGVVFISFANNLFFICLQLFNTLEAESIRYNKQDKRKKLYCEFDSFSEYEENKTSDTSAGQLIGLRSDRDGIKMIVDCKNRARISPLGGYEAAAYFLFSLVYLISRSVAVSLVASQVNSASHVPAPVLYDVPSPVYCAEVQRFLDQVNGDDVALSGLQFFNVTRGLLLTVAGTIVTYELVMFQFSPQQLADKLSDNINTTLFNDITTPTP